MSNDYRILRYRCSLEPKRRAISHSVIAVEPHPPHLDVLVDGSEGPIRFRIALGTGRVWHVHEELGKDPVSVGIYGELLR